MIFTKEHLVRIADGKKTETRRVWKAPHVKIGGIYRNEAQPMVGCQTPPISIGGVLTVPNFGERETQVPRIHELGEPLPTPTSHGSGPLIRPFLVKYYGTAKVSSVDSPMPTLTSHDRLMLVQPVIHGQALEVYQRMIQPPEMSRAMGFPKGYRYAGNRGQVVKQIGNAVAVNVARALCSSLTHNLGPGWPRDAPGRPRSPDRATDRPRDRWSPVVNGYGSPCR